MYETPASRRIWGLSIASTNSGCPGTNGAVHCVVYFGFVKAASAIFIEPHSHDNFFRRPGTYGYGDDAMRFAFFSKAALEFMLQANKRPDVIHCHDWPTGLLPVLLYDIYQHRGMHTQRVCFTMHNFRHQGQIGSRGAVGDRPRRPEHYFHPERLRDDLNRGPAEPRSRPASSIRISSPRCPTGIGGRRAAPTRILGWGTRCWPHSGKFGGVLNGVDYDVWNPEMDRLIAQRYGVGSLDDKYDNKRALRERFWLRDGFRPIVAYVGRLDSRRA